MKIISKALVGTVAAGAMAMASASPAQARDHRDHGGVDVGDVIAGALMIGGIAAIASAASNNRNRGAYRYGDDRRGYNSGYGNPRAAVEQCVYAAERTANRYSYGNRSKVTDIRRVRDRRGGFRVEGRIAVNQMGRDWRRGDHDRGRGWGNDHRGWNNRYRGYDSGKFTCDVNRGRISNLRFSGIRGL